MSEGRLRNAWVWKPTPGLLWRATCFDPREICDAATQEEAQAGLKQALGPLALGLHWIYEPSPGPRRPGGPSASSAPAVEHLTEKEREERITEAYRKGLLVVHPDKASDGPLDRG